MQPSCLADSLPELCQQSFNQLQTAIENQSPSSVASTSPIVVTPFDRQRGASTFKAAATLNCPDCNFTSPYSSSLKRHIKMKHHSMDMHPCHTCSILYATPEELENHQKEMHSAKFMCSMCSKCYTSANILRKHMVVHTGKYKHICSVCDKGFSDKIVYEDHMSVHQGIKQHVCQYCGATFTYRNNLHKHLKTCKGLKKIKEGLGETEVCKVCKYCGKRFASNDTLKQHEKYKHEMQNSFVCKCGMQFSWKSSFYNHEKRCPVAAPSVDQQNELPLLDSPYPLSM